MKSITFFVALSAFLLSTEPAEGKKEKLKPEELVALHLESVGPAESLAGRTSCAAQGQTKFEVIGDRGLLNGPSNLLSEGKKLHMAMIFSVDTYPGEEMVFDGEKVEVGQLQPGVRTALGEFLLQYDEIIQEGVFGGVLYSDWVLQDLERRNPKLKYDGLKEVDDVKYHTLKYQRRKGWDPTVLLYFDVETYQHRHTIYRVFRSAGARGSLDTRYILKESFSNFRQVDDLTLPSEWIVEYAIDYGGRSGRTIRLTTEFTKLFNNVPFDPKAFDPVLTSY